MVEQNAIQDQYSAGGGAPHQQKSRSGCWKYGAIGCLVIILLVIIGGFFAFKGIKGLLSEMTEKYTSVESMDLPSVEASAEEVAAILDRVRSFTNALKGDDRPAPLTLTSRDINILINDHPKWKELSGRAYVTIEGDQVKGEISIPLGEIGEMFEGRFLNGSAFFRVGMESGRLLLFLDSAEVAGEPLPEEIMNVMREQNLAEETNKRPDMVEVLKKLESITVQDGSLIISPKDHQQDQLK